MKFNYEVLYEIICWWLKVDYILCFWNEYNFVFKEGSCFYYVKGVILLIDVFVLDFYEGLWFILFNMSELVLIVKGEVIVGNFGFVFYGVGWNVSCL